MPKATILCVDDTPVNLRLLSGLLQPKGYEVALAADGRGALERVAAGRVDLVVESFDPARGDLNGFRER